MLIYVYAIYFELVLIIGYFMNHCDPMVI